MYLCFPDQNKFTQYQIVCIPLFQTLSEGGNQSLKVRCLILLDISTIIYIFRWSTMIFYVYYILFLLNMHKMRYFVYLIVQSSWYSRKCTLSVRKYRALFNLVTSTKIACLFYTKFLEKQKKKKCFNFMFTDSNLFILHCHAFGLESVAVQINNTSLSLKANADVHVMGFQNVCLEFSIGFIQNIIH